MSDLENPGWTRGTRLTWRGIPNDPLLAPLFALCAAVRACRDSAVSRLGDPTTETVVAESSFSRVTEKGGGLNGETSKETQTRGWAMTAGYHPGRKEREGSGVSSVFPFCSLSCSRRELNEECTEGEEENDVVRWERGRLNFTLFLYTTFRAFRYMFLLWCSGGRGTLLPVL